MSFVSTGGTPSEVAGLDVEALAKAGDGGVSHPSPLGLRLPASSTASTAAASVSGNSRPKGSTAGRRATLNRRPLLGVIAQNQGGSGGGGLKRPGRLESMMEEAPGGEYRPVSASVTHRKAEISAEPTTASQSVPSQYVKQMVEKTEEERTLIRAAVDDCLLFFGLSDLGKNEVVDAFHLVDGELTIGTLLIEEGAWGDEYFVLEHGTCEAVKEFVGVVKRYEAGGSFGELALMYNEPRAASVYVSSPMARLWSLDRLSFKNISMHFKVLKHKQYEEALRRVPGLGDIASDEMTRLVDSIEERTFPASSVIIAKGQALDEAMIILEGKADCITDTENYPVGVRDVFGLTALTKTDLADFTLQTAKDQTCLVLVLSRQKVEDILGNPLSPSPVVRNRPMSMAPIKVVNNAQHRYHIAVKFEDLDMLLGSGPAPVSPHHGSFTGRMLRADTVSDVPALPNETKHEIVLGVGTFGKVLIVKHKLTGDTYALKRLNKSWIVDNCLEQHVVDERNVMTLTDHPFVLKLHNSYYDERYVYLLLEVCLGGELFFYLRKFNKFSELQARFYTASITLAFEHLHSKNIIYRDLKPENIMLDDNGYLKVVDFGLAKVVKGRTWTICGTPEYLAPEVVLSKGHNRGVDWWGLGILIFELTAGYCPFVGDDNMVVYRLIVENKINFPTHTSPQLRDICKDFTRTSQLVRLGLRRPGSKAIKDHPWFDGFDWDALQNLTLEPPIQTVVRNRQDVSNFEEYTGSDQDQYEAELCDWKPDFPYQVINGKMQVPPPTPPHRKQ